MPNFVTIKEEEIEKIIDDGGLSKRTKQSRARVVQYFTDFLKGDANETIDSLIEKANEDNSEPLEEQIMAFFTFMRVSTANGDDLPKRGTIECYKSHLKQHFIDISNGTIDISSKKSFSKLERYFSGLMKKVKEEGRGDTEHRNG